MGTFVISQRLSGVYKYEFTSRKGKPIFTSNDFELRFEAEEEIQRLKVAIEQVIFMRFRSPRGKFYFKIILDKTEVAKSRQYTTQLLMQKGIDEIMRSLSVSEVLDFSASDDIFPPAEDVFGVL